jgi:hypothetical protein
MEPLPLIRLPAPFPRMRGEGICRTVECDERRRVARPLAPSKRGEG